MSSLSLSLSSQQKTSRVWRPAALNPFPSAKQPSGVEKGPLPWAATGLGGLNLRGKPSPRRPLLCSAGRLTNREGSHGAPVCRESNGVPALFIQRRDAAWDLENNSIICLTPKKREEIGDTQKPLTKKIKLFCISAWRILSKECPYPTFATFEKTRSWLSWKRPNGNILRTMLPSPLESRAKDCSLCQHQSNSRAGQLGIEVDSRRGLPRPSGCTQDVLQKPQLPENVKMHLDFTSVCCFSFQNSCIEFSSVPRLLASSGGEATRTLSFSHPCGPSLPDELRGWCRKVRAFLQRVGSCLRGSEDQFNPRNLVGLQPLLCLESCCPDVSRQNQTTGSPNVLGLCRPSEGGGSIGRLSPNSLDLKPRVKQAWGGAIRAAVAKKGTGEAKEAHKDGRETLDFLFLLKSTLQK
ncbi:hypothetical protein E2320_009462 [Naja naja]|nr:hypothetical protein E2320_009462 [Naja naja]